jgi:hypothetical protein
MAALLVRVLLIGIDIAMPPGHDIILGNDVFAADTASFAHTDRARRIKNECVLKSGNVLRCERGKLDNLMSCSDLGPRQIFGFSIVDTAHARRIDGQDAVFRPTPTPR